MSEPLRELLALFDISVDTEELEHANKKIDSFKDKITAVGKTVAEAFAVEMLSEFVDRQVEAATELDRTAQRLGLTVAELQTFSFAAASAGVQSEVMTNALRLLNLHLAEAKKGSGEGAALFQRLHIALKNGDGTVKDAGDVIGDLADRIKEIPGAAEKTEVAMRLLGRQGASLIPILNKGSEAFREAARDMNELGGARSEAYIESAKKVDDQQTRLKFATSALSAEIASHLFPIFEQWIKWDTEAVKSLVQFAKSTNILQEALYVLGTVAAVKAVQGITALAKSFGILKGSVYETLVAMKGFLVPVVLVGGLFLILEDLFTLMRGGKSVIGDDLDALDGFGTAAGLAQDLNGAVAETIDEFEGLAEIVTALVAGPVTMLWETFKGVGAAIFDILSGNWGQLGSDVAAAGQAIKDAFMGEGTSIAQGWDQAKSHKGWKDAHKGREPTGFTYGPEGGASPAGGHGAHPRAAHGFTFGRGAGGGGPLITQHNRTNVVVHTSAEPKPIADAVGQGVSTAQQRANVNALRSVKRS